MLYRFCRYSLCFPVHRTGQRLVLFIYGSAQPHYYETISMFSFYIYQSKSNYISWCKFSFFFAQKSYFFYFTHSFLQNTHISLSILHIYSIKYSFFYNFLLFSLSPLFSHRPNLKGPKPISLRTTLSLSLSQTQTTTTQTIRFQLRRSTRSSRRSSRRSLPRRFSGFQRLILLCYNCEG